MKTDVLATLSQAIRAPLQSLLGVLSLTMAGTQPQQREALGDICGDVRHLLGRIDDLLELIAERGAQSRGTGDRSARGVRPARQGWPIRPAAQDQPPRLRSPYTSSPEC